MDRDTYDAEISRSDDADIALPAFHVVEHIPHLDELVVPACHNAPPDVWVHVERGRRAVVR
jgi:hypothetical protein